MPDVRRLCAVCGKAIIADGAWAQPFGMQRSSPLEPPEKMLVACLPCCQLFAQHYLAGGNLTALDTAACQLIRRCHAAGMRSALVSSMATSLLSSSSALCRAALAGGVKVEAQGQANGDETAFQAAQRGLAAGGAGQGASEGLERGAKRAKRHEQPELVSLSGRLQSLWHSYTSKSPVEFDDKLHGDVCSSQQPALVVNDPCLGVRPGAVASLEERWCLDYGDIRAAKCDFTGFNNLLLSGARRSPSEDGPAAAAAGVSRRARGRYLLAGRPGCGKTSFCRTLLSEWSKGGQLSGGFDLVLFLPLAELDPTVLDSAISPLKLLCDTHAVLMQRQIAGGGAGLTEEALQTAIQAAGSRCLVVVDGVEALSAEPSRPLPGWLRVLLLGTETAGDHGSTDIATTAWASISCLLTCSKPLPQLLQPLVDVVDATVEILSTTAADFTRERTVMSRQYSSVWPNASLSLVANSPLMAALLRRIRTENLLESAFADDLRQIMDVLVEKLLALYPCALAGYPADQRQAAYATLGRIAWQGIHAPVATFTLDSFPSDGTASPEVLEALTSCVFVRPVRVLAAEEAGWASGHEEEAPRGGAGEKGGDDGARPRFKFLHPLFASYFATLFLESQDKLPAAMDLSPRYGLLWRMGSPALLRPRFEALVSAMKADPSCATTCREMARHFWRFRNSSLLDMVAGLGLQRLDLSYCSLGPLEAEGIRSIIDASASTITHLLLDSNPLTNSGVARLFDPPVTFPVLEVLGVSNIGAGEWADAGVW